MNNSIIATVVLVMFSMSSYSQTDSSRLALQPIQLTDGLDALQFHLLGEVSISYKHHYSPSSGLRFNLDFSGFLRNDKQDDTRYLSPTDSQLYSYNRSDNTDRQALRVSAEYVYYLNPPGFVKFFLATGPFASLTRYHSDGSRNDLSSTGTIISTFSNGETVLQIGASISAGLECTLLQNVTLLAEYTGSGGYGWTSTEYNSGTTANPYSYRTNYSVRRITLELSSVKIGFSVYL